MPAFLKAAMNVGRSCVSQRTDDFVSGSSTHAGVVAAALLSLPATRPDRDGQRAASAHDNGISDFFTFLLLLEMCRDVRRGILQPAVAAFMLPPPPGSCASCSGADRHLLPRSFRRRPAGVRLLGGTVVAEAHGRTLSTATEAGALGDEPGLGQDRPQCERRGTADGSPFAELRRTDLAAGPRGGEHPLAEHAADVVGEPGEERAEAPPRTTASTSNRFTAEASAMPR